MLPNTDQRACKAHETEGTSVCGLLVDLREYQSRSHQQGIRKPSLSPCPLCPQRLEIMNRSFGNPIGAEKEQLSTLARFWELPVAGRPDGSDETSDSRETFETSTWSETDAGYDDVQAWATGDDTCGEWERSCAGSELEGEGSSNVAASACDADDIGEVSESTDSRETFASSVGSEGGFGDADMLDCLSQAEHDHRNVVEVVGAPNTTEEGCQNFSLYDIDYQNFRVRPCEDVMLELCGGKAMVAGLRSEAAAGLSRLRRGAAGDPGNPDDEAAGSGDTDLEEEGRPRISSADVEVVFVSSPVYVYIKLAEAEAVFNALRDERTTVCTRDC